MKAKCTCGAGNVFWWIIQCFAYALGFYYLVMGVRLEWDGALWYAAVLKFAVGFFLIGFGKLCKWKSHQNCPVHQY